MLFSVIRFIQLESRLGKSEPEVQHYSVMAVMWSLIEINTSITVVNMPALMPILDWCLDFKKRVYEYMARASHGSAVGEGIALQKTKSRERILSSEFEPEDRQATYLNERSQASYRLQQPDIEGGTSSDDSIQEPARSFAYRITNE